MNDTFGYSNLVSAKLSCLKSNFSPSGVSGLSIVNSNGVPDPEPLWLHGLIGGVNKHKLCLMSLDGDFGDDEGIDEVDDEGVWLWWKWFFGVKFDMIITMTSKCNNSHQNIM